MIILKFKDDLSSNKGSYCPNYPNKEVSTSVKGDVRVLLKLLSSSY